MIFGAQPLEPEAYYEDLYNEAKSCAQKLNKWSGKHFADVEWYVVAPGAMENYAGLFSSPNRIFLDFKYTMNTIIIKHEAAHAAIVASDNSHDDAVFMLCSIPNK